MSTEKQQSAVEWLEEQINLGFYEIGLISAIKQAKEIENERLKEAYSMGRLGKSIKEFNESFNQKI
jgi:hypothetical protein